MERVVMKEFFVNILCGFIPGQQRRKRIRMTLNHILSIRKWVKFAKSFSDKKKPSIKYTYGYRCANFVVVIDEKYVFKFPLNVDNSWQIAEREQRITDALRKISPIKIPDMEIVKFENMAVRKYEYIKGIGFHSLDKLTQNKNAEHIAKQIAKFIYIIGKSDPKEISDLKNKKTDKPSIMHGWNQNDLWDNFIMDPKTFDVIGMIDWEGAGFNDFYNCFTTGIKNGVVKNALLREYLKLALKN